MIYTSYFAKLRKLPDSIVPVAICAKVPDWYSGTSYRKLAPTYDCLMSYKKTGNEAAFREQYYSEILNNLTATDVVLDLSRLIPGFNMGEQDVCLICYEKSTDFCHRHLVADWLNDEGYRCEEW